MSRSVAILQSNYLPWKGYFDIVHDVDLFVFYDDVQYTQHDWRNRNRIKTPQGVAWLTVPIGSARGRICDVPLPPGDWRQRHRAALERAYGATPYFADHAGLLDDIYAPGRWQTGLSALNQHVIRSISGVLGCATAFADSRDFAPVGGRQERLMDILRKTGATRYVSGPAARSYLDPAPFSAAGIELVWKDYCGYPEYPQPHPPFVHEVTVLDLLFCLGPGAAEAIWGWRRSALGTVAGAATATP